MQSILSISCHLGVIYPETVLDPEQLALVLVKGSGLAQARVGERAEFVIDGSALQSPSRVPPRAELRGQQGQLSVHVTPMASNNTFRYAIHKHACYKDGPT